MMATKVKEIPNRPAVVSINERGCIKRAAINKAPANATPDVTGTKLPCNIKIIKIVSDIRSNPVNANPNVTDTREKVSTVLVFART